MNIFVLDKDPSISAKYMCDKHVVKMILESCQLLSTAHRVLDGIKVETITSKNRKYTSYKMKDPYVLGTTIPFESFLYKSTMVNHPCSIWCRETSINYRWLAIHTISLIQEYTNRYSKTHASENLAYWLEKNFPKNIKFGHLTPFALAMPDQYKCSDAVLSYRKYYINEKSKFAKWKNGNTPTWYKEGLQIKNELVSA